MTSLNPSSGSIDTSKVVYPTELGITTPEQKQVYSSALEFERFFVQQLLKPMDKAGQLMSEDSQSSGDSGLSGYSDMAKDQMTQAVLDGGGLGLAATMYGQLAEAAGIGPKPAAPAAPAAPATPAATPQAGEA